MPEFDPRAYGPAFAPLLETDRRRPLDAGRPNAPAELKLLSIQTAFPRDVTDRDMAACCIAGVWLLYDCLDESHKISQDIETPTGSFWHAIMHRREGDFWNSKYWFRRVGKHPAFDAIAERAHVAASLRDANSSLRETCPREWEPFAFVDRCETVIQGSKESRDLCINMQLIEWEVLFDYSYAQAVHR